MKKGLVIFVSIAALCGAVFLFSSTTRNIPLSGIPPSRDLSMVFVGDIMLSRDVGALMERTNDWKWPFREIQSFLSGADVTVGNLETTMSARGKTSGCRYCFRSDVRATEGLTWAGFDILDIANNHTLDYGPEAFSDTLAALEFSGIKATGGGADIGAARRGAAVTMNGVTVTFIGYTNLLGSSAAATAASPGLNIYDSERMKEDIADARQGGDIVVVLFHGGEEYETVHNAAQERIYHTAVDAGADMVVGHHPHVVQEVERYGNGWIAYSLGNFVFDQSFSAATMSGLALRVRVTDGRIADVEQLPVSISKAFQPSLLP